MDGRLRLEDRWDNFTGPLHLLKSLYFGAPDSPLRRAGAIFFAGFGGGPDNGYTWVELEHDLTASLLQARLVECTPDQRGDRHAAMRRTAPRAGRRIQTDCVVYCGMRGIGIESRSRSPGSQVASSTPRQS